jgi:hypothetical protein
MGEHQFLKLLARVIKLHKDVRIYNTGYTRFEYELTEANGTLFLTVKFPSHNNKVTVSYETKQYDNFLEKLNEAEEYLYDKQHLTRRYF